MFQHDLIQLPQIHNEDTDNGRFYVTPDGNRYQSVTTFLSKFSDDDWLQEWIDRVGQDQAKRVSTQAKNRGTSVHAILEKIVLNDPKATFKQMPNNVAMAMSIAKILRDKVSSVRGVELGLWSDRMKMAGRTDMVGVYDGKLSIIDFKTAKYNKKEEDIESYFLQTTIYAMMLEELTGLDVEQIVVLIGVDFEPAQVFVKSSYVHRHKIKTMLKKLGV